MKNDRTFYPFCYLGVGGQEMKEEARIRQSFKKYRREHPFPRPVILNGKYFGDIVKEVFVPEWAGKELGDSVKVIQLISKKEIVGRPEEWLRFGYYRRKKRDDDFRWVSWTALMIEKPLWRRLMRDAESHDFW